MRRKSASNRKSRWNWRRQASRLTLVLWLSLVLWQTLVGVAGTRLMGQTHDPIQVKKWLWQLDDDLLAVRNSAEKNLIALGPAFSDWLGTSPESMVQTSEANFRRQRILSQIFKNHVLATGVASSMKIEAGWNADRAEAKIAAQTANRVSFSVGDDFQTNNIESLSFWNSLERICEQNDLVIDHAGSIDHSVLLVRASNAVTPAQFAANQGLVRIEWAGNPTEDPVRQVRLRILWEPRLRLVALEIPMSVVSLTDAAGQPWASFNADAVYTIPPPSSRNFVAFRLPVQAISTETLDRLIVPVELRIVAPDAKCVYNRVNERNYTGQTRQFGMASITMERIEIDARLMTVRMSTRYDPAEMAQPLQSHSDWSRFCLAEIVGDDGQRIAADNQRQVRQEPYLYVIEYTFPTPDKSKQDWHLNFQIPSGIISVEEKIELGPVE